MDFFKLYYLFIDKKNLIYMFLLKEFIGFDHLYISHDEVHP